MEVKKAAVDCEIEQEELQSEISKRESVWGEVIPALVPELSPHKPPMCASSSWWLYHSI